MSGELEAEQNCNILNPTLMALTAFLSRSPGLLNRGPHVPHSSNFSLLPVSVIISYSTQPVHGQGYILIFLDRMHLLFTQVHFLFWQLGRGQYVTVSTLATVGKNLEKCLEEYKIKWRRMEHSTDLLEFSESPWKPEIAEKDYQLTLV